MRRFFLCNFIEIHSTEARVCGSSLVGITRLNSTGGMHVCHFWMLCAVRCRSLRHADHSSREVLPSAVCLWSLNLKNVKAYFHDVSRAMKKCTLITHMFIYYLSFQYLNVVNRILFYYFLSSWLWGWKNEAFGEFPIFDFGIFLNIS